jgi:hypothetical protein
MVMRSVLALLLGVCLAFAPARSDGPEAVDLELVLAIDVSGSIDEEEAALQRRGYLQALVHPQVLEAIMGGEKRKIGIVYIEWAGYHYQRIVADWSVIRDKASAESFVSKIAEVPVGTERWTSISGAIEFAMKRLDASPYRGTRRVIDISGDGRNNNGRDLAEVRREALERGIVINGLPIVNDRPTRWGTPPERDLDLYYRDYVIGGPGSFYVVADGFNAFASAIRTKLVREISGAPGDGVIRVLAPKESRGE